MSNISVYVCMCLYRDIHTPTHEGMLKISLPDPQIWLNDQTLDIFLSLFGLPENISAEEADKQF